MIVKGMVTNIIFQNKDNGYTVAHIDSNGEKITIVGIIPALFEGQYIQATGKYVSNKKWGEQFDVSTLEITEPNTEQDIERYLASGLIPGVGPVTARNIVKMFGKDTLKVIEMTPLRLTSVRGVSRSKAEDIGQAFLDLRQMQDSVMFLQKYGISTNMSLKIYNRYGEMTERLLKDNPYRLVEDINGIGFRTADKIAKNLGIAPDSAFRMRAGIVFVLNDSSEKDGNTYLPIEKMRAELVKLLDIDLDSNGAVIEDVMKQLILEGFIKQLEIDNEQCVMLVKFYLMEQRIANKLLMLGARDDVVLDISDDIARYETLNGVEFHSDQRKAIEVAVNNGVAVITGGPGTGKTTIIKCILSILKAQKKSINLLAPTGRAAKRMSESTGEDASTIHRALMLEYRDEDSDSGFIRTERNPLTEDVIIVDEVSMVDVQLMSNLLSALKPTAKLILVGDKNQLPSVGAGNVLADIIKSKIVAYAELTKIYRQNEKSLIITNAHAINNGKMPIIDNSSRDFFFEKRVEADDILRTIIELQATRIPRFMNIEPQKIQVLAPLRAGVVGVDNLNNNIQNILNPARYGVKEVKHGDTTFRVGDKVMHIVNNYNLEWRKRTNGLWQQGEAVFNGDMGVVTNAFPDASSIEVTFEDGRIANYTKTDLAQLTLSYAITIHKSQGSEFDVVLIPLTGGAPSIMTRNLLYTAVTRAKKMVVLVGQQFHLKIMVNNNYTATRYSALDKFILEQKSKMEDLLR